MIDEQAYQIVFNKTFINPKNYIREVIEAYEAAKQPEREELGGRTEKDWLIDNMAMLIRTLAYSLSKIEKYRKKAENANDFLIRHGLQGSPLRADSPTASNKEDL